MREKPGTEGDESRWRLDHDYIARAILAESRYASWLMQQLQEGNAAWNAPGSNVAQRIRTLLPLAAQAKFLWALDGLNSDSRQGAAAVLALWELSPVVRDAVVDHLLNSPARLRAVGSDRVHAVTSIEPATARGLADRLRERLAKEPDPAMRQSLIEAYVRAATRLDPADAAKAASDLRERLAKEPNPGMRRYLIANSDLFRPPIPTNNRPPQHGSSRPACGLVDKALPL